MDKSDESSSVLLLAGTEAIALGLALISLDPAVSESIIAVWRQRLGQSLYKWTDI
jgi:hypothetical protein